MSGIMQLRNDYKDAFVEKHGVKLGFMSAFVKAAVSALQEVPAVNGVIDGTDIVYREFYDISVAVGTAKGLVVPVLRKCAAPESAQPCSRGEAAQLPPAPVVPNEGREQQSAWWADACPLRAALSPSPFAQRGQAVVCRDREGHCCAGQEGTRRDAQRGRHGRRHFHHQQRRRLRLASQVYKRASACIASPALRLETVVLSFTHSVPRLYPPSPLQHADREPATVGHPRHARNRGAAGGGEGSNRRAPDHERGAHIRPPHHRWA